MASVFSQVPMDDASSSSSSSSEEGSPVPVGADKPSMKRKADDKEEEEESDDEEEAEMEEAEKEILKITKWTFKQLMAVMAYLRFAATGLCQEIEKAITHRLSTVGRMKLYNSPETKSSPPGTMHRGLAAFFTHLLDQTVHDPEEEAYKIMNEAKNMPETVGSAPKRKRITGFRQESRSCTMENLGYKMYYCQYEGDHKDVAYVGIGTHIIEGGIIGIGKTTLVEHIVKFWNMITRSLKAVTVINIVVDDVMCAFNGIGNIYNEEILKMFYTHNKEGFLAPQEFDEGILVGCVLSKLITDITDSLEKVLNSSDKHGQEIMINIFASRDLRRSTLAFGKMHLSERIKNFIGKQGATLNNVLWKCCSIAELFDLGNTLTYVDLEEILASNYEMTFEDICKWSYENVLRRGRIGEIQAFPNFETFSKVFTDMFEGLRGEYSLTDSARAMKIAFADDFNRFLAIAMTPPTYYHDRTTLRTEDEIVALNGNIFRGMIDLLLTMIMGRLQNSMIVYHKMEGVELFDLIDGFRVSTFVTLDSGVYWNEHFVFNPKSEFLTYTNIIWGDEVVILPSIRMRELEYFGKQISEFWDHKKVYTSIDGGVGIWNNEVDNFMVLWGNSYRIPVLRANLRKHLSEFMFTQPKNGKYLFVEMTPHYKAKKNRVDMPVSDNQEICDMVVF